MRGLTMPSRSALLLTVIGAAVSPAFAHRDRQESLILIEQITLHGRTEAGHATCLGSDCSQEFDLPIVATPRRYEMRAHFADRSIHIDFYAVFPFYRWDRSLAASGIAEISLKNGFGTQDVPLHWLSRDPDFDRDGVDLRALLIAQIHVTVAISRR